MRFYNPSQINRFVTFLPFKCFILDIQQDTYNNFVIYKFVNL